MRAYEVSAVIRKDEFYPQNVTYQTTGHLPDCIRQELQGISDQLFDHARSWIYSNADECQGVIDGRLNVLLEAYHPTTAAAILENVVFIPAGAK